MIDVRLWPAVVGSEATRPCSSAGVAARACICCRTQQALVRRDSGPPRKCLRQSYSLVPRPFLRTREEFEIRGARERVWSRPSHRLARATVGMLARLERNAVSVLCIRPTVLCSVART